VLKKMPSTAGKKRSVATKKMDFLDSDDSDEPTPKKKAAVVKAAPVKAAPVQAEPAYVAPVAEPTQ